MKIVPVWLAVFLLALAGAHAKELSFAPENVAIEIPDTWETTQTPPGASRPEARNYAMLRNAGGDRFMAFFIHEIPLKTPLAIDAFVEGSQKPLRDKGWQVFPVQNETFNNLPFTIYSVAMQPDQPPQMFMAGTFTPERGYSIQGISKVGDPAKDPEIQAILRSFHFLQPVESVRHGDAAYRVGYLVGRTIVPILLLIVVAIVIIAIVRRSK